MDERSTSSYIRDRDSSDQLTKHTGPPIQAISIIVGLSVESARVEYDWVLTPVQV